MYINPVGGGPCHVKEEYTQCADTSLSYAVIGLDLAKADCAVAAVPCSDELGLIDRMDYESLFLEPFLRWSLAAATGFPAPAKYGHEVKVISGHAVKNWIQRTSQIRKTDLNDATALAKLALYDRSTADSRQER